MEMLEHTKQSEKRDFRRAAVRADEGSTDLIELALVWRQLVSGSSRVIDNFYTETRFYIVLAHKEQAREGQSGLRRVDYLERFLLGEAQKAAAMDADIARSTIAMRLAECLHAMGVGRRASRAPLLLAAAAHASHGSSGTKAGRLSVLSESELCSRVVSIARPDQVLADRLSPAECSVARLLVEGKTHAEIAELRRSSTRTVANQLAAAFQKLGVSGRSELLRYVVCTEPAAGYARQASEPRGLAFNDRNPAPARSDRLAAS